MIVSILKMLQCFIFEYLQIVPREGTCFIVHSRGTTFRYNCIFEIFNFLICCIFSILEMLFSFSFYLYLVKAKGDTTARAIIPLFTKTLEIKNKKKITLKNKNQRLMFVNQFSFSHF